MDPVILISTALTLATPYLLKTGEKIAESVGEDIWKLIKKPFSNQEEKVLMTEFKTASEVDKLKATLLEKINADSNYRLELERAVDKGQKVMAAYHQQNVHNKSSIGKQINIQENNGNIQM